MTTRIRIATKALAVALVVSWAGAATAGIEGDSNTQYGKNAGFMLGGASGSNSLFGAGAGLANATAVGNTIVGYLAGGNATEGNYSTYVGTFAGYNNTAGLGHTIVGAWAGNNSFGVERNVFLGYGAGYTESGSHKLYIDNCAIVVSAGCDTPFIKGDFMERLLEIDGVLGVTANRSAQAVKSQLHFSVTGEDVGGWITSAGENNFFTSSGARYDAGAGGWIQRSADGKAVIAGSGAAGFRVLTSSGASVGGVAVPVSRLHIDYAGLMGVNTVPMAGRAINTSTGAYLSSGGVWTNASSRALKRNIHELSSEQALQAFQELKPVTFEYNEGGRHVGFIAEDVPALVATEDRKGLAAMDVVAVLTKVVQRQEAQIERLNALVAELAAMVRQPK